MYRLIVLVSLLLSLESLAQNFPAKMTGHWKGELSWYRNGKKTPDKLAMQLIILPADTAGQFTWQLIYGEGNKDNRPYLLKPVDTVKGHWQVDERNGILIDLYWLADRMTSAFTVQQTTIVNSYYWKKKKLVAEFYSFSKEATTSGGKGDIPPVYSYRLKGYQKAVLKRKK